MLPISFEESHVGTMSTMSKRRLNKGLKQVNTATGQYWDRRILPTAFRSNAWIKRGYKKRTKATRDRKENLAKRGKAKFGGKRDLVESGLLMESVADARHRVTANKSQATVWVPGPSYFRDQIAHEVMKIIPEDADQMNKIANEEFGEFIKSSKHRSKFKTKG